MILYVSLLQAGCDSDCLWTPTNGGWRSEWVSLNCTRGLDNYGIALDERRTYETRRFFHPDARERMTIEDRSKFLSEVPHEGEARLVRKDEKYRWFLFRRNPLQDEQGRLTRWDVAETDIEDRKRAEKRLQVENVGLREEIDTVLARREGVRIYAIARMLTLISDRETTLAA